MPDRGYRSIEISVTNDTRGDLVVQAPTCGANDSWIQGEVPSQGDPLNQYNAATWGVLTKDVNNSASGHVQLTGLGSFPVTISFVNDSNGNSSCTVAPNDQVRAIVTPGGASERNHSAYNVQLIPA
jgi:hypothetical protein